MHVTLNNEAETVRLGQKLGQSLACGMIVLLHGDLGAGKTTLVKGVAKAFAVEQPVTSPTFSLLNTYRGDRELAHIDAYRLNGAREGFEAGLEDYLPGEGVTMVEWPEKIAELLPADVLELKFSYLDEGKRRRVEINAKGEAYNKVIQKLEETWCDTGVRNSDLCNQRCRD